MIVDAFMVYSIIRRLAKPFNKWKAYDLGIIDKNGQVLKKELTSTERQSFTMMDRLILNIKKLIPSDRRLASYAAAMFLIKEGHEYSDAKFMSEDYLKERLEFYEGYVTELCEEAPTVNAGGGNVAGIGVGEDGEPGFTKQAMDKYKRKNRKSKMHTRKELEEK